MADDEESLDDILSPSSKTTTPEIESTEAQPVTPEPVRDEHGRFAPKAEEPTVVEEQPETPEQPEAEAEHGVPVGAMVEQRRRAQQAEQRAEKLERELAELRGQVTVLTQQRPQPAPAPQQQEPPKAIELWDDPNKWGENLLSPVQQQLAEMTFRTSRAEALADFGKDTVAAAEAAIKEAVASGQVDGQRLTAQLSKSRDPVGDVVRWHQNSPAVQKATLRDQLRAELMAELGIKPGEPAQPSTPSTRTPLVKMPPSLSKIPAGHSAPERDESLDEVLSQPRRARA